jgi:hypothetical protein
MAARAAAAAPESVDLAPAACRSRSGRPACRTPCARQARARRRRRRPLAPSGGPVSPRSSSSAAPPASPCCEQEAQHAPWAGPHEDWAGPPNAGARARLDTQVLPPQGCCRGRAKRPGPRGPHRSCSADLKVGSSERSVFLNAMAAAARLGPAPLVRSSSVPGSAPPAAASSSSAMVYVTCAHAHGSRRLSREGRAVGSSVTGGCDGVVCCSGSGGACAGGAPADLVRGLGRRGRGHLVGAARLRHHHRVRHLQRVAAQPRLRRVLIGETRHAHAHVEHHAGPHARSGLARRGLAAAKGTSAQAGPRPSDAGWQAGRPSSPHGPPQNAPPGRVQHQPALAELQAHAEAAVLG